MNDFNAPGPDPCASLSPQARFILDASFFAPRPEACPSRAAAARFAMDRGFHAPRPESCLSAAAQARFSFAIDFGAPGPLVCSSVAPQALFIWDGNYGAFHAPPPDSCGSGAPQAYFQFRGGHLRFDAPPPNSCPCSAPQAVFSGLATLATPPEVFPWEPDWASGVRRRYGYLSGLSFADDGREQREQLRDNPGGTIAYSLTLIEANEAQAIGAFLYANARQRIAIPVWSHRQPLSGVATAGGNTVPVVTTYQPFRAIGWALLWRSHTSWELVRIASVAADQLILVNPLAATWSPPGIWVLPVEVGRLSEEETVDWASLLAAGASLEFRLEASR